MALFENGNIHEDEVEPSYIQKKLEQLLTVVVTTGQWGGGGWGSALSKSYSNMISWAVTSKQRYVDFTREK